MQGRRWIDPEKKIEYLEWLMLPPGEREPSTKTAMAESLGVTMRTLYNWEGEQEFQDKLRSLKVEWGNRWYPDILQRLMDVVVHGPPAQSVAAAKVLLQHIDIKDDSGNDAVDIDEELRKRMAEVARSLGYEVLEDDE